ncbi:MAG: Minf_1886 family protein [Fibrobacterota bacterium]
MPNKIITPIQRYAEEHGRAYKLQAYLFVMNGLEYTLKKTGKSPDMTAAERHVTGQELSRGIKDYAITQYGPSAKLVLEHWGITATLDFGRIVYDLIDLSFMGKNDTDRIEDFDNVFEFEAAFVTDYPFTIKP